MFMNTLGEKGKKRERETERQTDRQAKIYKNTETSERQQLLNIEDDKIR